MISWFLKSSRACPLPSMCCRRAISDGQQPNKGQGNERYPTIYCSMVPAPGGPSFFDKDSGPRDNDIVSMWCQPLDQNTILPDAEHDCGFAISGSKNAVQIIIFLIYFFYIFLSCFDVLILKLIFKKQKILF
jgi:hypothetical protein